MPSAAAVGPWATDMLHGRLLAGLAAWAIEREHPAEGFVPVRLTVDMFRNPPMLPATVRTAVVRAGGRVRAFDAVVTMGGKDVGRASALFLRTGTEPGDDPVWTSTPWDAPDPETLTDLAADGGYEAPFDVRPTDPAGFGAPGVRQVWVRDRRELVAGAPMTPFVRAALVADIASPLANYGALGLDYINADLTLHLGRLPVGEWIGAETSQRIAADGVSVAVTSLHDVTGPLGACTVCAVLNPRMTS